MIECCVGERHFQFCCFLFPFVPVFPLAHTKCILAEFIHLISSEANDICEKGAKKTIAPEHVVKALAVSRSHPTNCARSAQRQTDRRWLTLSLSFASTPLPRILDSRVSSTKSKACYRIINNNKKCVRFRRPSLSIPFFLPPSLPPPIPFRRPLADTHWHPRLLALAVHRTARRKRHEWNRAA